MIYRQAKGKFRSITGHEGSEVEQKYSSILSLILALEGVGGQCHSPVALPPGKRPSTQFTGSYRGLSGGARKIWSPQRFDPRTIQPVATRFTDRATPAGT